MPLILDDYLEHETNYDGYYFTYLFLYSTKGSILIKYHVDILFREILDVYMRSDLIIKFLE